MSLWLDDEYHDPYGGCEGINFKDMKSLTQYQRQRLNRLAEKLGHLSACEHDLVRGILTTDLVSGDGDYEGNAMYQGSITTRPSTHGLAVLRGVG